MTTRSPPAFELLADRGAGKLTVVAQATLLKRISVDPAICGGRPCIPGHRVWVSLVLDFLAAGNSVDEVLAEYPGIERDDVLACIAYGAEMSRLRDIPARPAAE